MILELHDGVKELLAGVAEPVPVLDHVGVQVDGCGEAAVTNIAGHILVIWKQRRFNTSCSVYFPPV